MSYERRRSYGGGFKPCPVEMGKEYEVDICMHACEQE